MQGGVLSSVHRLVKHIIILVIDGSTEENGQVVLTYWGLLVDDEVQEAAASAGHGVQLHQSLDLLRSCKLYFLLLLADQVEAGQAGSGKRFEWKKVQVKENLNIFKKINWNRTFFIFIG